MAKRRHYNFFFGWQVVLILIAIFTIVYQLPKYNITKTTINELGYVCGNLQCEPGEKPENCYSDCCGGGKGTNPANFCGDGLCIGYACGEDNKSSSHYCAKDCAPICGDGICNKGEGPNNNYAYPCPEDCKWQVCGNGICEGTEGVNICPEDCHGNIDCRYPGEITCMPENSQEYKVCLDDNTYSGMYHCDTGLICKMIILHQDHYSGECTAR